MFDQKARLVEFPVTVKGGDAKRVCLDYQMF